MHIPGTDKDFDFGRKYWILHRLPMKWLARNLNRHQFMMVSGILIGLTAGFCAVLLKTVVHYFNEIITYLSQGHKYYYLVFPALGILITVTVVKYFFKGKDGKGIAKILYEIAQKSSVVEKTKMYSQLIGSSITVGFGGSSGLEGPIAVTGAAIGSNYGRVYNLSYRDRTLLLAAGAAGGIAGVFNAPVTGVMFAVEVILSGVSIIEFIPLILAAVSGTVFSQIILNEGILFSFRHRQIFDYHNIPFYALLGFICGAVSLYYAYVVLKIESFFHRFKRGIFMKALLGGIILAILCFVFPSLFGEGYHAVRDLADDNPVRSFDGNFWVPYLHNEWILLLLISVIALVKAIATSATIFSGGNGGNFAPSLFVGAHVGYVVSKLINHSGWFKVPVSNFTLVGMCGILSGVLYAPLTAIFLIAEITGGYDLIVPLMIVASTSYFLTRSVEPYSMETRKMAKKGEILTGNKDTNVLTRIRMEAWIEKDISTIHPDATLRQLIELVKKSHRHIFAVVDIQHRLLGIVLMDDLKEVMFDQAKYDSVIVSSLMHAPPAIVERTEDMRSVMRKFDDTNSWNLPVTDNGVYIGFVSKSSLLHGYRNELIRQS